MKEPVHNVSLTRYPKNLLLRRPVTGASVIAIFNFLFLMIYRPLDTQPGYLLSYELTMALYCGGAGLAALAAILLINRSGFFGQERDWTLPRELAAILLVIAAMGTTTYLLAFLIEEPADRWNLATLADSFRLTLIIGGVPLYLFSIFNIHLLFSTSLTPANSAGSDESGRDQIITIDTPLKKEELSFTPAEFLYAESDGNYLNVFLEREGTIRREVIRIAISSFEEQLVSHPQLMRTHRAYLVNLKKVAEARGNSLGYRLRLPGVPAELPVSRRHTALFRKLCEAPGAATPDRDSLG